MGQVWEWMKANPYIAGGCLFVFFVIVIIMSSGTNTEEVSDAVVGGAPDYSAAIAAGHSLQQMTIQGQVASRMSDNDLASKVAETNAAVSIGKANFDYLSNKDVLAAKVGVRALEADEYVSRMAHNTAAAGFRAQVDVAGTQANAATAIAKAGFDRDLQVAGLMAGVENNKTTAAANIAQWSINAAKEVRSLELTHDYNSQVLQTGHAANIRGMELTSGYNLRSMELDTERQLAAAGYSHAASESAKQLNYQHYQANLDFNAKNLQTLASHGYGR